MARIIGVDMDRDIEEALTRNLRRQAAAAAKPGLNGVRCLGVRQLKAWLLNDTKASRRLPNPAEVIELNSALYRRTGRNAGVPALGVSVDDYEKMHRSQGGLCAICGKPGDGRKSLAVDHCHTSGKVRGLLCLNCNTALGHFKDNPVLLLKAALYLEHHKGDAGQTEAGSNGCAGQAELHVCDSGYASA